MCMCWFVLMKALIKAAQMVLIILLAGTMHMMVAGLFIPQWGIQTKHTATAIL
jgi:hypothetical protein